MSWRRRRHTGLERRCVGDELHEFRPRRPKPLGNHAALSVPPFDVEQPLVGGHPLPVGSSSQVAVRQGYRHHRSFVLELGESGVEPSQPGLVPCSRVMSNKAGKSIVPTTPQMLRSVERMEAARHQLGRVPDIVEVRSGHEDVSVLIR